MKSHELPPILQLFFLKARSQAFDFEEARLHSVGETGGGDLVGMAPAWLQIHNQYKGHLVGGSKHVFYIVLFRLVLTNG